MVHMITCQPYKKAVRLLEKEKLEITQQQKKMPKQGEKKVWKVGSTSIGNLGPSLKLHSLAPVPLSQALNI